MRWSTRLLAAPFALTLAGVVASCRAPTQARVVVTTTAPCAEVNGVAITAKATPRATEGAVDGGFVSATTTACVQRGAVGDYGDLVLAPGEDTGAVVVVAGYGPTRPEGCKPANQYKGCIVARRAFSYIAHATITIPVSLDPDCVDVPCDALTTCKKGRCVDSRVECTESGCTGDSLPPPGGADAGPDAADGAGPSDAGGDATAPADAADDGSAPDGGTSDGATGSGMEGRCIIEDGPPCGGDAGATKCTGGDTCCGYGAFPVCTGGGGCLGGTMCCDSSAMCGPGERCCGPQSPSSAQYKCQPAAACDPTMTSVVCRTAADCPAVGGGLVASCLPFVPGFKRCAYN